MVYFKYELKYINFIKFLFIQFYFEFLIRKRTLKTIRATLKNLTTESGTYNYIYKDTMEQINGQIKD
jgi:hypothetical protein